jgi:hypothetical protein
MQYEQVFAIQSDKFDVNLLDSYSLYLYINENTFKLVVIDTASPSVLVIEHYKINTIDILVQQQALSELYQQHAWLSAGFWKDIKVCVNSPYFVLVPNYLFDENEKEKYLFFTKQISTEKEIVFHYRHTQLPIVNIFSLPKIWWNWFQQAHPHKNIVPLHSTCSLIEGGSIYESSQDKRLHLYISAQNVTFTAFEGKNLLFCNQFSYKGEIDFVYYTLLVLESLKMDKNIHKVIVWGDLPENDKLILTLKRQIHQITLGEKPKDLFFSYQFDEIPSHNGFDMYCLYLC